MSKQLDKVLIVDDDPEVRALLREDILVPSRFSVCEAKDGPEGLEQVNQFGPDLIILDLVMPGLSGADFLVALKASGYSGPIIVETKRGSEAMAIDAFRLGATDYLTKPLREAEALQVIEHGLAEVHMRRERVELLNRLQESNRQLEARIKELTALNAIGKTVSAMYDLEQIFKGVLDAAVSTIGADHATLILRDEETNRLILRAGKNMTLIMQEKLGEAVNDNIAELVMSSGEPLIVAGDALKRFSVSTDLLAVIYAPLMIQGKPIGVLTVGNHRKRHTFDKNQANLLETLAGYASISIANARLFTALERRARNIERAYEELKVRDASRERVVAGIVSLRESLVTVQSDLKKLIKESGSLPKKLADPLSALGTRINNLLASVDELSRRENSK